MTQLGIKLTTSWSLRQTFYQVNPFELGHLEWYNDLLHARKELPQSLTVSHYHHRLSWSSTDIFILVTNQYSTINKFQQQYW